MVLEPTTRRAAGLGLSVASVLMVAVLLVHGPVAPEIGVQMQRTGVDPQSGAGEDHEPVAR